MSAAQARTGSRHGGGQGAARARAARLCHSAADCRVQNRTHAAQARLQTHVCANEHLLTTNRRLCQNASHVADSSGRHEAQVRGDDVHAREHTSPAGIGSAAEPGGWPAGGGGCARQDKLVHTVLSEHADLGTCQGSRGQPHQPAISRPHSTAYNRKDERPARTGHNTSRASRLPRLQNSPGDEAPEQPRC